MIIEPTPRSRRATVAGAPGAATAAIVRAAGRLRAIGLLAALFGTIGCSPVSSPSPILTPGPSTVVATARPSDPATPTATSPATPGPYQLGRFPDLTAGSVDGAIADALQAVLTGAADRLPGLSAAVMSADAGTWSGAAGTADGIALLEAASSFGIASITKTIVAAEVMRLAERGTLSLADPVSEHLPPGFDFDANGATVRDLLAMESGIPDPEIGPEFWAAGPDHVWTVQEVLATVPDARTPPGVSFVYEDANFMLLALVIEEATGTTVARALRSDLLADPRFASIVYQPEERPLGPVALPFLNGTVRPDVLEAGGGYLPSANEASQANGSGGMAADAPTLALWGYLAFGGSLLSETSLIAMTDFGSGVTYDRYGLGVFEQTDLAGGFAVQAVGNAGWHDGGYSTALVILPSEATVIAVMTNTAGDPRTLVIPVAQQLAAVLAR